MSPTSRGRLPRIATYRIQLGPAFDFAAAASVVADLARLGVSHLYLSPVAEAVPGSTHGYDVVDPARVRDELGGRDGLWALARAAAREGLGVVIDLVPNHVATGAGPRNAWWWSVLAGGAAAPEASWFDIDWAHGDDRVIVPVLGADPAEEIASGALHIVDDEIHYHDQRFPVAPGTSGTDVAAVLAAQHYRLQPWRDPDRNVRRFFTIDDLVAIRPEEGPVHTAVHRVARDLHHDGLLDGVRVDHVDGLADPSRYLRTLREAVGDDTWVLVEKILAADEALPDRWPVDGTTGYEWITLVDHLFTHPDGERPFTDHWERVAGDRRPYREVEQEAVREVLAGALRPDLERVARAVAPRVTAPAAVDHPAIAAALVELTVALGRYRTYLTTRGHPDDHARLIRSVATEAADRLPADEAATLAAVVDVLVRGGEATTRWQQLTGPALAKGGEDRALYRWLRLVAHNEVGGDPDRWTTPLAELHGFAIATAAHQPTTLLAGSTHDTKRSEDVRARLLALTERPDTWLGLYEAVADEPGAPGVDAVSLHLALQTAFGAWPIDAGRLGDHLVKAAREADRATSWTDPDPDHEAALHRLAAWITGPAVAPRIAAVVAELEPAARAVSHAQLVLRLTAPGVPDVYQGGERPLLTLVDPDNRRPLDATRLRATVDALPASGSVWSAPDPKPAVLSRTLATRRRRAACFAPGGVYEPIPVEGRFADHVIAFHRRATDGDRVAVVVARHPGSRPDGWHDTAVGLDGRGLDVLAGTDHRSGGWAPLATLLGDRPAAVVVADA